MWFCPKCKELIEENCDYCWKCNISREESSSEETRKVYGSSDSDFIENHGNNAVEAKYPALRTISGIYNLFSWLAGIATIIVGFVLANQSRDYGLPVFLAVLLAGLIIVISLRAVSEIIHVFIDIEENTRKSATKR